MTNNRHRGLRILVIEDNVEIRQILHDFLKSFGHDVRIAADGESGLAELKNDTFDLMITDLGLPGMSGWELSRAAKRYQTGMAVVAISSWQGRKTVMKIEEYGVDQVIWKPFRFDQIKDVIDQVCGRGPAKFPANKT